jgi:hypothetical protein
MSPVTEAGTADVASPDVQLAATTEDVDMDDAADAIITSFQSEDEHGDDIEDILDAYAAKPDAGESAADEEEDQVNLAPSGYGVPVMVPSFTGK